MHRNPACGRRALAANSAPRPPQQQQLRPGGGPPTKSVFVPHPQRCASTLPVGGAPSRRIRRRGHLNSKSFAPGAGLLQRACSYLTHSHAPQPCLWEARPRGERGPAATSTATASPRGRASYKERVRTSPQRCACTLPVGGAPSRRTRPRGHLNSNSFAPGLASHKERVRTCPPQYASTLPVGGEPSRRTRPRGHLNSKRFAPGAGLPQRACSYLTHSHAPEPCLWEARPRSERGPAATSTATASPRRRASHKERVRTSPQRCTSTLPVGGAPSRRTRSRGHLNSKRFAPGAGLPQRACSYLTHSHAPEPCLWEARPRGEPSPVATSTANALMGTGASPR